MSMSNSLNKNDNNNQMTIFEIIKNCSTTPAAPTQGAFNITEKLRISMREAIKSCPLSRYQIAGQMSHLLDEEITADQVNSWTRENQQDPNGLVKRHIPAEYLPAFCEVVKSSEPLKVMGSPCGVFILPGPEALRAEIQKITEEISKAQERKKKRMLFLNEMEKKA
jgi:hypothetical protein